VPHVLEGYRDGRIYRDAYLKTVRRARTSSAGFGTISGFGIPLGAMMLIFFTS